MSRELPKLITEGLVPPEDLVASNVSSRVTTGVLDSSIRNVQNSLSILSNMFDPLYFAVSPGVVQLHGSTGGLVSLKVNDIDDPSPELHVREGSDEGEILLTYETSEEWNEFTIYGWDSTSSLVEDIPYIVRGPVGTGFWVALGGKYIFSNMYVKGTLFSEVVRTSRLFVDSTAEIDSLIATNVSATNVTTSEIEVSSLDSLRLVSSDAEDKLESTDLVDWIIAGDNIVVTDAGDGKVAISLDSTAEIDLVGSVIAGNNIIVTDVGDGKVQISLDSTTEIDYLIIDRSLFNGVAEFLDDIYIGNFVFPDNSGPVIGFDMGVTSDSFPGTEQSIKFRIDSEDFITLYSESDGAGGIQNDEVRIDKRLVLSENGYQEVYSYVGSLGDDEYIDLPSSLKGFIVVHFSGGAEYGFCSITTGAVVTLLHNSANMVNTDTDAKYCIFDNGTNVRVRNRIGSAKDVSIFGFISQ
jgi:hypothetical protein